MYAPDLHCVQCDTRLSWGTDSLTICDYCGQDLHLNKTNGAACNVLVTRPDPELKGVILNFRLCQDCAYGDG